MTVHAFVDESARNSRYLIAAALVDPSQLRPLRRSLPRLLLPGQRELHCYREKPARRRQLADAVARLPVEIHIYSRAYCRRPEPARQECIERLAHDLLARQAHRLVLDSRAERNVHDQRTLHRLLRPHPSASRLVYEHVDSTSETLLWIADIAAWCHGAGGAWRKRLDPVTTAVIDLD